MPLVSLFVMTFPGGCLSRTPSGDDDQMNAHKELGGSEQKVSKLLKW